MKKILLSFSAAILLAASASAQAPNAINYQAAIRNGAGAPLASASVPVRFTVRDLTASGAIVYQETNTASTNAQGVLNTAIGTGTPVSGTFAGINWATGDKFLEVEVDAGSGLISIANQKMMSVPFALYAASGTPGPIGPAGPTGPTGATGPTGPAGSATISGTTNKLIRFTGSTTGGDAQMTDDGTSVGLGVSTLSSGIKLQVNAGSISNSIKGTLVGAPSTTIATSGSIYGESTTGIGIIGVSGSHNGVYGLSTGTLGGTVGVNTSTGYGIWGVTTGSGVAGFFDGGTNGKGIIVKTGASYFGDTTQKGRLTAIQPSTSVPAIDTFPAITGYSYTSQGCLKGGVYGTYNTSNYGAGVQGIGYNGINNQNSNAIFTTGNQDIGVYGSANTAGVEGTSVGGIGVAGYNKTASFAAVTGGGNTYGVYGYANTIGGAAAPATRYGVYGYATGATTNIAGYFSGNVQVTGSISKGSGTFKIDHPLDPENKYLYHSFVESPDMMNIYNGNATTDASGYATVTMPAYFQALNQDFRYQITTIGSFSAVMIAEKMNGNTFRIRSQEPNVEVSWQVTGIRHDKYADAHRVIAEVEKEPEFKGRYLHAAEWGATEEKSIDAVTRPKTSAETAQQAKEINTENANTPTQKTQQNASVGGAEVKINK